MNLFPHVFRRGFSLIELLITVAVISLLTGLTMAGYGAFNKKQTVKTEAYKLASNLRLAQQKAISGEKPAGCFGDLQSWNIIINAGGNGYYLNAVCAPTSPANPSDTLFPVNISISPVSATITFAAMTGAFAGAANVTYTITGNFSGTSYFNTIEITPSGGINVD